MEKGRDFYVWKKERGPVLGNCGEAAAEENAKLKHRREPPHEYCVYNPFRTIRAHLT